MDLCIIRAAPMLVLISTVTELYAVSANVGDSQMTMYAFWFCCRTVFPAGLLYMKAVAFGVVSGLLPGVTLLMSVTTSDCVEVTDPLYMLASEKFPACTATTTVPLVRSTSACATASFNGIARAVTLLVELVNPVM